MQAVFSLGFALASVYHVCHMHDEGLHKSEVFGISGPLWRTWDILCAQWLLARTFGHAVGARHWVTQGDHFFMRFSMYFAHTRFWQHRLSQNTTSRNLSPPLLQTLSTANMTHAHHVERNTLTAAVQCAVITNTVFPAVCLYYFWTASGALPMRIIMHTLVAVMLTTLAAKLLVEGVHTLPKYCKTRGMTALGEPQHCPTVLSAVQATYHVHTLMYWNESAVQTIYHVHVVMYWDVFAVQGLV